MWLSSCVYQTRFFSVLCISMYFNVTCIFFNIWRIIIGLGWTDRSLIPSLSISQGEEQFKFLAFGVRGDKKNYSLGRKEYKRKQIAVLAGLSGIYGMTGHRGQKGLVICLRQSNNTSFWFFLFKYILLLLVI